MKKDYKQMLIDLRDLSIEISYMLQPFKPSLVPFALEGEKMEIIRDENGYVIGLLESDRYRKK